MRQMSTSRSLRGQPGFAWLLRAGRGVKRVSRSAAHRIETLARTRLLFGVQPLAQQWFERGFPIHRYYLEHFLQTHASDIRGHCLEFQEDSYTTRFGGTRVTALDILHKERDALSGHATLIADLTRPNSIPSDTFDCIICTYVLHVIADIDRLVAELHRILRTNGVLLVAVPDITINYPEHNELWRFTAKGLRQVLGTVFEGSIEAVSFGNSLVAAGELRGLTVKDFSPATLSYQDARYGLLTCARALKAARAQKKGSTSPGAEPTGNRSVRGGTVG